MGRIYPGRLSGTLFRATGPIPQIWPLRTAYFSDVRASNSDILEGFAHQRENAIIAARGHPGEEGPISKPYSIKNIQGGCILDRPCFSSFHRPRAARSVLFIFAETASGRAPHRSNFFRRIARYAISTPRRNSSVPRLAYPALTVTDRSLFAADRLKSSRKRAESAYHRLPG